MIKILLHLFAHLIKLLLMLILNHQLDQNVHKTYNLIILEGLNIYNQYVFLIQMNVLHLQYMQYLIHEHHFNF